MLVKKDASGPEANNEGAKSDSEMKEQINEIANNDLDRGQK